MGFGHADLILAVPACWRDCENLDDLAAITRQFRAAHGFRLRIATKYHRLVRAFLAEHEVADYQLVDSQGATEGTVKNETAEAIAVRDLATGAVRSIPRGETKEVKLGGTVMPDGLTAGMDERQLAHLVRYLMGLGE